MTTQNSQNWPASLGTLKEVSGKEPFVLSGAESMWSVVAGVVYVFLQEPDKGGGTGRRVRLFTVNPGQVIFAFPPAKGTDDWLIIGVPGKSTTISTFSPERFWDSIGEHRESAVSLLTNWQTHLEDTHLAGYRVEFAPAPLPDDLVRKGRDWIQGLNEQFFGQVPEMVERFRQRWDHSFETKGLMRLNTLQATYRRMRDIIRGVSSRKIDPQAGSVVNACLIVLTELKVSPEVQLKGVATSAGLPSVEQVRHIAQASGFRIRRVSLSKGNWWQEDGVPMVGFKADSGEAVALIPTGKRSYYAIDPESNRETRVTKEYVHNLDDSAWIFYKPFPNKPVGVWDLMKFSLSGNGWDISYAMVWGGVVALLAMIPPIVTSQVFNQAIPHADRGLLLQMLVILLGCGVASWGISYVQATCIVRFSARADYMTQAAVWDRLLGLPVSFFRDYSAGDLADRAMSITKIKQTLTASTISGIISGIFSITSVIMMVYYSWQLAITAVVLVLGFALLTSAVSYFIYQQQVILANTEGELSGLTLQFFTGITKLRAAGAELDAFHNWVDIFQRKKTAYRKSGQWQMTMQALGKNIKLFVMIALFFVYFIFLRGHEAGGGLSTGSFMAFYTAYGSFQAAILMMLQGIFVLLHCVPQYRRLEPILAAQPEMSSDKPIPEKLSGQISVNNVSFRYVQGGPLILDNVSIHINPGEFIAIVGDSGSGKSTLLRLLLGFEFAEDGSIIYDSSDISKVDLRGLRRQIGVVLQNGKILQGSIYDNIVGSSAVLTMDDAWRAARMAGCEDDIKAMPMQMQTVVTAGGGTLSGGQRQRIMIARSIVSSPKILFFDEATSALDNRTQKIVSESLEQLQATRVVIAHRLSTIENADRIYVLIKGKIVEHGNYQELIDKKGTFYELAKRQIA